MLSLFQVLNERDPDFTNLSDGDKIKAVQIILQKPQILYERLNTIDSDFQELSPQEKKNVINNLLRTTTIVGRQGISFFTSRNEKDAVKEQQQAIDQLKKEGRFINLPTIEDKPQENLGLLDKTKEGAKQGLASLYGEFLATYYKLIGNNEKLQDIRNTLDYINKETQSKGTEIPRFISEIVFNPLNAIPVANVVRTGSALTKLATIGINAGIVGTSSFLENYGTTDSNKELAKDVGISMLLGAGLTALPLLFKAKTPSAKKVEKLAEEVKNKVKSGKPVSEEEINLIDNVLQEEFEKGNFELKDPSYAKLLVNPKKQPNEIDIDKLTQFGKKDIISSPFRPINPDAESNDIIQSILSKGDINKNLLTDIGNSLDNTKINLPSDAIDNIVLKNITEDSFIKSPFRPVDPAETDLYKIRTNLTPEIIENIVSKYATEDGYLNIPVKIISSGAENTTKKIGVESLGGSIAHEGKYITFHTTPRVGASLAAGAIAGFEVDQDGNFTFNPEKFIKYTLLFGGLFMGTKYYKPFVQESLSILKKNVDKDGFINTTLKYLEDTQQEIINRTDKTFNHVLALGKDLYSAYLKRKAYINTLENSLLKLTKPLSQASRDLQTFAYDYLTNPEAKASYKGIKEYFKKYFNADMSDDVFNNVLKYVAQSKFIINKLGKQLVEEGIIPKESFLRFENRYLPRMFLAYALEESEAVVSKVSPDNYKLYPYKQRKLDLQESIAKLQNSKYQSMLKGFGIEYLSKYDKTGATLHYRELAKKLNEFLGDLKDTISTKEKINFIKDLKDLERGTLATNFRNLLGEIKKSDFLVIEAIKKAGYNLINKEFLNTIAKNPSYILDSEPLLMKGLNGKDIKITLGDVRKTYEELLDRLTYAKELSSEGSVERIQQELNKLTKFAKENNIDLTKPFNYKKLEGAVFGNLNGKYVREDVYSVLKTVYKFELNTPEFIRDLNSAAVKFTNFWKKAHTAYNLPTHFRNIISNIFLNSMDGYSVPTQIKDLYTLLNTGEFKKFWDLASREGLVQSTMATNELRAIQQGALEVLKKDLDKNIITQVTAVHDIIQKAAETLKATDRQLVELYQNGDNLFRVLRFYHEIVRNKQSVADAAMIAAKDLLDYSDVPHFIEMARKSPFSVLAMPFVTFTYKMIGKLLNKAVTDPVSIVAPYLYIYVAQDALLETYGLDRKTLNAYIQLLPDHIKRKADGILPGVFFIPKKDGSMYALDLSYLLPQEVGVSLIRNLSNLNVSGILQQLGVNGMPLVNLIYGVLTQTDPFTKKPIVKDVYEGEDYENLYKSKEWAKWFISQTLPTMLNPNYGAFKHISNYLTDKTNIWGEKEGAETLLRPFGINIYQTGSPSAIYYRLKEAEATMKDLEKKLYIDMLNNINDPKEFVKRANRFFSAYKNNVQDLIALQTAIRTVLQAYNKRNIQDNQTNEINQILNNTNLN